MPTASNIVLADGQATPVNHTFIPLGRDTNGVFWFEDQSQSNAIGYWKLSLETKRPLPGAPGAASGKDRVARVKWALHEPQLETLGTADNGLTPPPTIAYINRANGEFILAERGTKQNRKDLRVMAGGLLAHATFIALVDDLQAIVG